MQLIFKENFYNLKKVERYVSILILNSLFLKIIVISL